MVCADDFERTSESELIDYYNSMKKLSDEARLKALERIDIGVYDDNGNLIGEKVINADYED